MCVNENVIVVEAWNTVLFDKFERFKHLLVAGLSGHSDELLRRGLYRPGERVLDVGCGFGDSTLRIARAASAAKCVRFSTLRSDVPTSFIQASWIRAVGCSVCAPPWSRIMRSASACSSP